MRSIKRKILSTKVQVLESKAGNVSEVGFLVLEGEADIKKIKKLLMSKYPNQNVFYGNMETTEKVYQMSADEFMKNATVIENESN